MRNREGRNLDVADPEALARLNLLNTIEALGMLLGKNAQRFGVRGSGEIHRGVAPLLPEERGEPANMIGMFVRDENAVEALCGLLDRGKAAERFALAKPRVNEETRLRRLDQRTVARAARSKNADSQA